MAALLKTALVSLALAPLQVDAGFVPPSFSTDVQRQSPCADGAPPICADGTPFSPPMRGGQQQGGFGGFQQQGGFGDFGGFQQGQDQFGGFGQQQRGGGRRGLLQFGGRSGGGGGGRQGGFGGLQQGGFDGQQQSFGGRQGGFGGRQQGGFGGQQGGFGGGRQGGFGGQQQGGMGGRQSPCADGSRPICADGTTLSGGPGGGRQGGFGGLQQGGQRGGGGGRGGTSLEEKTAMDAAKLQFANACYAELTSCGIDVDAFLSRQVPGAVDAFGAYVNLREQAVQCGQQAIATETASEDCMAGIDILDAVKAQFGHGRGGLS